MEEKIPELYATEKTAFDKKIIYQRYQIKELGFYWLVAELDRKRNLAFGYANLNDDIMAEWGYISIEELLENGAELDRHWKPCTYKEAISRVAREKEMRRREGCRHERVTFRDFGFAYCADCWKQLLNE